MEQVLTTCLAKICDEMIREPALEKKIKLIDDVTEFLLVTPDVFSSTDLTWRHLLYESVQHLISNKMPARDRKKVFKLISALVMGFGRINWFMSPAGDWCEADVRYFNLLARYACVEIVMLLDDGQHQDFDSDFLGCLMIILEHSLTCLVECDAVTTFLTADQISGLVVAVRSVGRAMIDFASVHKHEDHLSLVIRAIVRLVSLWIREDPGGVSTSAGITFVEILVSVLCRQGVTSQASGDDAHELIHAAVTSITALPSDCIPILHDHRKEMSELLAACQDHDDPKSCCRIVCDSFSSFIDADHSSSLSDHTSHD